MKPVGESVYEGAAKEHQESYWCMYLTTQVTREGEKTEECRREPPADTLGIREGSLKDYVFATTPNSGLLG